MATHASPKITVGVEELTTLIESVVRKVVHEELALLVAGQPGTLVLREDSPSTRIWRRSSNEVSAARRGCTLRPRYGMSD
jgi:hypothetical protein